VHELTFTLVTVALWGQAAIDQTAMEFSRRYDGSLAIHSVSLGGCPAGARPTDPGISQESWFRREFHWMRIRDALRARSGKSSTLPPATWRSPRLGTPGAAT